MAQPTLLVSASLAVAASAAFLAVAWRVAGGRPGSVEANAWRARLGFSVFWACAGILAATQAARMLLALMGEATLPRVRALEQLTTPVYCIGAAGIVAYVTVLLSGRARFRFPIGAYYLALVPVLRYHVEAANPVGVEVTGWQVNYVYEGSLQSASYTLAVLATVLPVVLAVLAYASLWWRVRDPVSRRRVALVSVGLLLWVGTEAFAFVSGLAAVPAGEILRRSASLVGAMAILWGYGPPREVKEDGEALARRVAQLV